MYTYIYTHIYMDKYIETILRSCQMVRVLAIRYCSLSSACGSLR